MMLSLEKNEVGTVRSLIPPLDRRKKENHGHIEVLRHYSPRTCDMQSHERGETDTSRGASAPPN